MAKEDFCFTYYDGDAARDKAHMNRLERGAYDDLISAQRKRGHLSIADIKKVLSSDFDSCWPALEWILKKDDAEKYFIEWVDVSIEKMRRNSEKQKQKAFKRWNSNATDMPQHNNGIVSAMPLEDGNGNGNEIEEKEKGVQGEKQLGHMMLQNFISENPGYPQHPIHDIEAICTFANFIADQNGIKNRIGAHTDAEKRLILSEWGKISSWYKSSQISKGLMFVSRFQIQEAYTQSKNNLSNGKSYRGNIGQPEFKGAGGY